MATGVRFAPSPTGAFHIGNLRTAWISYAIAKTLGQSWILRFEDIDRPRVVVGAVQNQLNDMRQLGLEANPSDIHLQSKSLARHFEVFLNAFKRGDVYPCTCSRQDVFNELGEISSAPHASIPLYSGRCRNLPPSHAAGSRHSSLAWRFRAESSDGSGDFIIARTPNLEDRQLNTFVPSYNWACAIDDFDGNYTLIVRAWDLSQVAGQQRAIQRMLARYEGKPEYWIPGVFHCALVTDDNGHRLEKRTKGVTLSELKQAHEWPEKIPKILIARFEQSFKMPNPLCGRSGDFLGEDQREIKLSELLSVQ